MANNWKAYSSGYMLGNKAYLMRSREWWTLICDALEIEEEYFALGEGISDESVLEYASRVIHAKADKQIKKIKEIKKLAGG